MSKIETGGPAFPISLPGWGDNGASGMTLRDHFAGLAVQGFAQASAARDWPFSIQQMAQEAYEWADAMIAAREGGAK